MGAKDRQLRISAQHYDYEYHDFAPPCFSHADSVLALASIEARPPNIISQD